MLRVPRRAVLTAAMSMAACRRESTDATARPGGLAEGEAVKVAGSERGSTQLTSGTQGPSSIPQRPLGRTGTSVSIIGIGGAHLGRAEEAEGIRIVKSAIDRGVTFLDNCWDYNKGKSEDVMGKALEGGYRQRAFLMTKLDGRTKKAATEQLEQSLRRLRTDYIDLVQIHEVIRPDDAERSFREGGCIEALIAARQAGKIRFVGFTGHKDPAHHLAMLAEADKRGFRFDTVQMPLNVMDAHFRSFEKRVLPVLVEKGIGVLGMKAIGSGEILESGVVTAEECLLYAMSLPTSVVITGCESMRILDQAISIAAKFQPLNTEDVARLLARTQVAASEGKYERFKTSQKYDGTAQNPKWLVSAEL